MISCRNLTALAARGTRFDHAYVSIPRTFPSWVTLLTGRHAHHHGIRSMFPRWEERARDFDARPERLSRAGYATGVVSDYAGDGAQPGTRPAGRAATRPGGRAAARGGLPAQPAPAAVQRARHFPALPRTRPALSPAAGLATGATIGPTTGPGTRPTGPADPEFRRIPAAPPATSGAG